MVKKSSMAQRRCSRPLIIALNDILAKEKSEVLQIIFLTEYDENKHMGQSFKEGREEILLEKIQKKLEKGKRIEQIAEGNFCYDKGDWYDC